MEGNDEGMELSTYKMPSKYWSSQAKKANIRPNSENIWPNLADLVKYCLTFDRNNKKVWSNWANTTRRMDMKGGQVVKADKYWSLIVRLSRWISLEGKQA